jgi:transposase InsO family protein
MNDVLHPFLRRFVLVFFDDILIYSTSWSEHLQHVGLVFTALRAHDLFLKRSKCSFGTPSVARAFFDGIVRLHGFPNSIVSDRDPVFTSNLWRDLFKCAGVKQRLSTAFHPQTDGQSEVVNKVIAMYLRCDR